MREALKIIGVLSGKPIAEITLPPPPTINGLYAGKARRYKSPNYKAWLTEANYALNLQELPKIKGKIAVIYCIPKNDKRKRDCANYEKACSDLLVSREIIEDDSLIELNCQSWRKGKACKVLIFNWKEFN